MKLNLILFIHFFQSIALAQFPTIQIKYAVENGFYLDDNIQKVLIDYPIHLMESVDGWDDKDYQPIFLFTHKNSNNYSKKKCKNIEGKYFGPFKFSNSKGISLEELNGVYRNLNVEIIEKKNSTNSKKHFSYLLTWHGKKIFIAGKTLDLSFLENERNFDLILLSEAQYEQIQTKNIDFESNKIGVYQLSNSEKQLQNLPENVEVLNESNDMIYIRY